MRENTKREPYIVRVPVRGLLSKTFDNWEKARKEVGDIIERKLKRQLERIKAESKCEYVV